MEGLRVQIENYRAIAKADIALAELTVLTGVNASGKSTLARLFHHTVETNRNFATRATRVALRQVAWRPLRAFIDFAGSGGIDWRQIRVLSDALSGWRDGMVNIAHLREVINKIFAFSNFRAIVSADSRILDAFNRMADTTLQNVSDVHDFLNKCLDKAQTRVDAYLKHEGDAQPFLESRGQDRWLEARQLQVWDGETLIFDRQQPRHAVPEIYSPKRSIYIRQELGGFDFSFAVPTLTRENKNLVLHFGGSDYLIDPSLVGVSQTTMFADGHFVAPPNQDSVRWGEWCYIRKDGATFQYPDCAEGIKALAPLQVLDSYGLLDSNTLLILDEPEVHLHPQWIVKCAEALVNLVAERRVRVLVASHSPYMIQALQRFAAQALGKGQFRFYLAEEAEGVPFGYTYRDLGEKIGPIFKTFNVALDRIASYEVSGEE